MILPRDVSTVEIPEDHYSKVKQYAKDLCIGGKSSVFKDHEERMRKLPINQLTGQIGEYGGLTDMYGVEMYFSKQNQQIRKGCGDGGSDVVGSRIPIDIKSSCVNVGEKGLPAVLWSRRLMVTKEEYNPNIIYVGCAVTEFPSYESETARVHVIGWTWGKNLHWEEWIDSKTKELKRGFRTFYGKLTPMSRTNWKGYLA